MRGGLEREDPDSGTGNGTGGQGARRTGGPRIETRRRMEKPRISRGSSLKSLRSSKAGGNNLQYNGMILWIKKKAF